MRKKELIKIACFLHTKEWSYTEIAKKLVTPRSTVHRWVTENIYLYEGETEEWDWNGTDMDDLLSKWSNNETNRDDSTGVQDTNGPVLGRIEVELIKNSLENLTKKLEHHTITEHDEHNFPEMRGAIALLEDVYHKLSGKVELLIKNQEKLTKSVQELKVELAIVKVQKGLFGS